jgi:protein phosphatase
MDHQVFLSVFGRTDVGMQRSGNEDAFLVADLTTGNVGLGLEPSAIPVGERGSLLVVSDGMGGAVAGEVASELAVTTLRESLMEMPGDFGAAEQLKIAAEIANERIWNHARLNPELTGMGATLTGVLVYFDIAYIAQVGDSRAYLIRGRQIKQLTKDQSLVQMLLDAQAITPEQASSVPQNVIMQALGTQPVVKVVMTGVKLCKNDFLLLCSDGLSNKVTPEEMRRVVLESENVNNACRRLIEMANERGGEDNITVVIAHFDGEALNAVADSMTITGSFVAVTDDQSRKVTRRDLPEIDADEAAQVTTLVASVKAPTDEEPVEEEIQYEEPPTDRLDPAHVVAFDQSPTTRLDQDETLGQTVEAAAPQTVAIRRRKKSYTPILVFAIIAAVLLAGVFLFRRFFIQQNQPQKPAVQEPKTDTPPPPPVEEQKTEETKSEPTKSEETKSEETKPEQPKPESEPPK